MLWVVWFQLKMMIENWKMGLVLLIAPVLFVIGLGIVANQLFSEEARVQLFKVAVVDQDDTLETKFVIQQLVQSKHLSSLIDTIQTDEAHAWQLMRENQIAAMIILPQGFSYEVKRGNNTPVEVIGNQRQPLQSILVRYLMESAAHFTSAAQSGINTITYFLREENVSIEERQEEFRKSIVRFSLHTLGRGDIYDVQVKESVFQKDLLQYYLLSCYLLLMMIWSYGILFLTQEQKSVSLRQRLLSRGITDVQMCLAQLISAVTLLLPMTIGLAFVLSYWDVEVESPSHMIAGLAVVNGVFVSFFIMLQTVFKSDRIYQWISVVTMMLGVIAGGHLLPRVYFPSWLEKLGEYMINTWALQLVFSIFGQAEEQDTFLAYNVLVGILLGCILLICLAHHWQKRRWKT